MPAWEDGKQVFPSLLLFIIKQFSPLGGFPGGTAVWNLPAMQETEHAGLIPWRRKGQPTPPFLPGKSHGQRSLTGYSPRGHKETDTT